MTEKIDPKTTESIELNLEDTISDWSQVIEDAMAAVDTTEENDDASQDGVDVIGEEAAAEEEGPSEAEIELRMKAERLEAESSGLRDRLARTLADFENFRKRSEREKEQIERFALTDVLKDFLGVYDNLGRALAASGNAEDLKQGVDMIARQFYDLMRRYGVEAVDAVGEPFDPKLHEAVASNESTEVEAPTVTDEHQRGYVLHDRLLRPAMVTVAMPAPKPVPDENAADENAADENAADENAADEDAPDEDAPDEDAADEDAADDGEPEEAPETVSASEDEPEGTEEARETTEMPAG